jgi:small subunit ribosomal protein S1
VAKSVAAAASWELDTTEVTDLDDDLGEADTVVAAQAFDPSEAGLAATDPPPEAVPATQWKSAPAPEAAPETAPEAVPASAAESAPAPESATEAAAPPEPVEDLSNADLTLLDPLPLQDPPEVGAIFRGRIGAVAESGHIAIVNRVIDKAAVRKAIRAARAQHNRVVGVVYGFNRGGFDVLVGGVRAFCPASAMSLTPIEDPNAFVGQRCEFSLPQDKGGKKSIIVSRRNILEKEARKRARERMAELEVGAKLEGKVLEVRDYGVLVDLGGGLDGLVHMSEVSWSRGMRPQDAAKVGDEVDVEVLKVQPATRKDRYGRVSLSMRACLPDPWEAAKDTLRPGTPVKGKVVRTTDFGAFVEIQESIEGLLHISELGGSKELTHAKQAVTEGDEIDVVVERVDKEQRRISLSKLSEQDAKAIEAGEIEFGKAPRSLKPGTHVSVIVKRIEHGGAQVQVEGMLGKRGRGFIPNRELQDVRGEKRKGPHQGDVIEVKIIGSERDGTLRCSIRARLLDEERRAVKEYRKESAKQGLGTFGDLLKAKLGGDDD